ncbi:unnamed protein product [Clonostachys rhizophaga]|uniref:Uncharacterized protein n=1 Tax=Clonostachys rhizophaga TaxID=160324 RepID=A0A9N9YSD3_9HYPO|nr:unnamed protein product [Clonostachys rhizophaga]
MTAVDLRLGVIPQALISGAARTAGTAWSMITVTASALQNAIALKKGNLVQSRSDQLAVKTVLQSVENNMVQKKTFSSTDWRTHGRAEESNGGGGGEEGEDGENEVVGGGGGDGDEEGEHDENKVVVVVVILKKGRRIRMSDGVERKQRRKSRRKRRRSIKATTTRR